MKWFSHFNEQLATRRLSKNEKHRWKLYWYRHRRLQVCRMHVQMKTMASLALILSPFIWTNNAMNHACSLAFTPFSFLTYQHYSSTTSPYCPEVEWWSTRATNSCSCTLIASKWTLFSFRSLSRHPTLLFCPLSFVVELLLITHIHPESLQLNNIG